MKPALRFAALGFVGLLVVPLAAQGALTGTIGTSNLASPNALADGDTRIELDWRYWKGGNDTFAGAVEYGVSDRLDVGVTYVHFDNAGTGPRRRAVRGSELDGPGINLKWVGRKVEADDYGWSVVPGIEFLDMTGTNLVVGGVASDEETVFTLEVPIGIPDGDVLWIIAPKLASFPETQPVSGPVGVGLPARVLHFDTVIGIGLGVIAPLDNRENWWIHADVTPIIAGGNSIARANTVTVQTPWSIGIRFITDIISDDTEFDLFVTNAAGATTATSLIAAPEKTVSFGGAVSVEF